MDVRRAALIVDPRYGVEFRDALRTDPPVQLVHDGVARVLPHVALDHDPLATVRAASSVELLASTPHRAIELFIDVSDDSSELTIYRGPRDAGLLEPQAIDLADWEPIASFPSQGLLYPDAYIGRHLGHNSSRLITLYSRGRRNTRYREIIVNWDHAVDRQTWTTNIDTVIFLRNLEQRGILADPTLHHVAEIGVGGGQIATTLATRLPALASLTVSDIILPALRCAVRNIGYYAPPSLRLTAMLGKGIQALPAGLDLMLCNPPYIPVPPQRLKADGDPYRGTGLIREIIRHGFEKATRVLLQVSSMTLPDLRRHADETGRQLAFLAESEAIPLKIEYLDAAWTDWLVSEGGLERRDDPEASYPLWHRLLMVEIRP